MSTVLYQSIIGATFDAGRLQQSNRIREYRQNVVEVLQLRGNSLAAQILVDVPWELRLIVDFFSNEFALHARLVLPEYEEVRGMRTSTAHADALIQIAEVFTELGAPIKFIAIDLDPTRQNRSVDSRSLTQKEIQKLVNKYIGVSGGYLGDFSYKTHHEFYVDLDLDINPNDLPGTTRQRFIQILSTSEPDVQARILNGVLSRFPADSTPDRTRALHDEILGWVSRLTTAAAVSVKRVSTTSEIVDRARVANLVIPDLAWCSERSRLKSLSTRCPFASVDLCPRYYLSVAALGAWNIATQLMPAESSRLETKWKQHPLWPKTAEESPVISGPNGKAHIFTHFCPEVAFNTFGLFATCLASYADELDRDLAHESLGRRDASRDDWHWHWAGVTEMHYSDCPLYAPLLRNNEDPTSRIDNENTTSPIRVFITYTQDSQEQMDRVWDLSERLRRDGVDCRIDQHEVSPKGGWPRWCKDQIRDSQFVLTLCNETYQRRYDGHEDAGTGKGARWEGYVVTQELYEAGANNTKFIPIIFNSADRNFIPTELRGATHYDLSGDKGYEQLFRHITGQPLRIASAVAASVRRMASMIGLERKSSSPNPALEPTKPISSSTYPRGVVIRPSAIDDLTLKEMELLWTAAKSPDGQILYSRTSDGEDICANERHFLEGADARGASEWISALRSLEVRGLIEALSDDRFFFRVTGAGYAAADELEDFARWDARLITLRAHYINADTQQLQLSCKSIIRVPATYYPDDVGADGSVMRSLKEPRLLLVDGVGPDPNIDWQPNEVEFLGDPSGKVEIFRVDSAEYIRPGKLKLSIT